MIKAKDYQLKSGEFLLSGIKYTRTSAIDYLRDQGNTMMEALDYLKGLPIRKEDK